MNPPPPPTVIDAIKYPKFITPDILCHLNGINHTPDWVSLVKLYLDFEVASPSRSVSVFLYFYY